MTIELQNISKRYTEEWILRNVTFDFTNNHIYGIKGSNGSGKSTLIKIISGFLSPSLGEVVYEKSSGEKISNDEIYKLCSLWGPHTGLLQHMNIEEIVKFFFTFKDYQVSLNYNSFIELLALPVPLNRSVKSISSGQTQRLGLALNILSDAQILLLDEPSSFLDVASQRWLFNLLEKFSKDRIVIIASNENKDLELATDFIDVELYQ